jgi:hypothetical protein
MSQSKPPADVAVAADRTELPRTVYQSRIAERSTALASQARLDLIASSLRFAVMGLGLVAAWLSLQSQLFSPFWLLIPLLVFGGLMAWHERVLRARSRAAKALEFYQRGLARMDFVAGSGDFPRSPKDLDGARYLEADHPYASDLDIFGPRSLFELISVARTVTGRDRLASWLAAPATVEEARRRQEAVAELRERLDLRERLAVLGGEVDDALDRNPLIEWARGGSDGGSDTPGEGAVANEPRGRRLLLRSLLVLLAAANVMSILGWAFLDWGGRPIALMVLVGVVVVALFRKRVQRAIEGVGKASADLQLLSELLIELEGDTFSSALLAERVAELHQHGRSPGREIKRLVRLVDLLDSRRNAIFAPIGAMLYWTTHLALSVESWRRRVGGSVLRWLEIVGDLEALSSLAAYAFENPADPFPQLYEPVAGELPIYFGRGLGHPLIPISECVRNDIQLGHPDVSDSEEAGWQGYIVSGSNMSGKSTFLRTTGINIVLAFAGAPVRAESLAATRMQVGASIRVQDSLQEGTSRFYAEIKRLRLVLALTEGALDEGAVDEGPSREDRVSLPVYFLLDEILHGTNSHDRRIGAEAVVRAFLERRAIGLVTTHDLALARIVDDQTLDLRNVHFEDRIEDGKMLFDYRLHEGVVERSNALELMRQVGLEV